MKILFCTNAFENVTNGPVRFANIILEINDLYPEHELRILTEDVSESRLAALKHVYKLDLYIPSFLKPFGQILRWFIYYKKIKEIEQEYDFDVLVFINSFNGLWASMISKKPTAGMINDEKNMLATLQNFKLKPLWIKRFTFQFFEKLSAKNHKLIIANSEYLKEKIIRTYQLPPKKVQRLYKSIPLTGFEFNSNRAFEQPIKVLFVKADYLVGQLDKVALALSKLTDHQFLLTVVGPEPQFETHLRSLFVNMPNIKLDYVGPQPQEVVFEYMTYYDIFCVPSYTEAFGVANIEALAHGLAVVSSDVGGIPEVLYGGKNGWLVDSKSVESLANALRECIENPTLRLEKAQNGRNFINKFQKNEMLNSFIAMLKMTLLSVIILHSINLSAQTPTEFPTTTPQNSNTIPLVSSTVQSGLIPYIPKSGFENTPFLTPNHSWVSGYIKTIKGKIFRVDSLRYNYFDQNIEYVYRGRQLYPDFPISEFGYNYGPVFKVMTSDEKNIGYEIIYDGKTKLFLNSTCIKRDVTAYNSASKLYSFDFTDEYMLIPADGTPTKAFGLKKSLLTALKNHEKEINEFIKANRLKLKDPNDWKKLLTYYDGL